jgi:hypothetical protein
MRIHLLIISTLANLDCRIRRDIYTLNKIELETLIRGFKWLYREGVLEKLSNKHYSLQKVIHGCAQFLPFHNTFIYDLETELMRYNNTITLPYWNWTIYAHQPIKDPVLRFFGDYSNKRIKNCVTTGNFANWTFNGNCFKREFYNDSGHHPMWSTISHLVYSTDSFSTMAQNLERLHAFLHIWVSGDMKSHHSPNDPLFYLHHTFVDKIWYDWRSKWDTLKYGWKNNDNTTASFSDIINGYNLTVTDVLSNKNCVKYVNQLSTFTSSELLYSKKYLLQNNLIIDNNLIDFLEMNNFNNESINKFINNLSSSSSNSSDSDYILLNVFFILFLY